MMTKVKRTRRDWTNAIAGSALAGAFCTPIASAQPAQKTTHAGRQVALTIDDGPAVGAGGDFDVFRNISSKLRKTFVDLNVPAIMFVNERQLHVEGQRDARVAVLEEWIEAGLEVGNHTFSHRRLSKSRLHEFYDDVIRGEVISRELLRKRSERIDWFRYPYLSSDSGERAEQVEKFLTERGYRIAPVTVDYKDYTYASAYSQRLRAGDEDGLASLKSAVLRHCDDAFEAAELQSLRLTGDEIPQILLVHCNELNSDTLGDIIKRIRSRGYEFVSLATAMRHPAYRTPGLPPGSLGGAFYSGLESVVFGDD
ncbi:MAG: polysaccharide deacetylase family protein [Aureliella sp.]